MTALAVEPAEASVGVAQIADLLTDLSQVQVELLHLLKEKQERLAKGSSDEINSLAEREQDLARRLEQCHQRRAALLTFAQQEGMPADSIASLASVLPRDQQHSIKQHVKETAARMRLLQHHSLVNWVLAQRALLHVAQLLEIVATGGRLQPTYGSGANPVSRGNLLNSEA